MEGEGIKNEVPSMPGVYQISLDYLKEEAEELLSLGIRAVMLFGVPGDKDEQGSGAFADSGIVQQATRLIKKKHPNCLLSPIRVYANIHHMATVVSFIITMWITMSH